MIGDGGLETELRSAAPVFISYASQDAAIAEQIRVALETASITCWIAPRDVRVGQSYAAAIVDAINSCQLLLLVLTQGAVQSPHVLREVERASSKRRPVLAVRMDDAQLPPDLEYFLSATQWFDASRGPLNPLVAALVAAVRDHIGGAATRSGVTSTAALGARRQGSPAQPTRPQWRWLTALTVAALVLGGGYFALDRLFLSRHSAAPPPTSGTPPDKSVAVLPLTNLSGASENAYLGDGISGEILSALSKLPGLKVIGHVSSFQFRDREVDAVKVGKALNVQSLLTGTVQRAGDKLRVSVELIDTRSGVQMWAQHFDRSFDNLFALEDDISNAVSTTLAIKLGMSAGQPLVHTATEDPRAHDLYLRARELSYRSDEASLNTAVNLFNQAISTDPNYAAAWAGLAYSYLFLADAYRAPIDLLPVMKAAAEKAVALDPKLAEAHAYLSYILVAYERNYLVGERELQQALALNPGSADVQFFVGTDRILTRQAAAAQSAFLKAEKLDPLNPFIPFVQVWAVTALGDSATALQKARRALEIDPSFSYFTDPLLLVHGSFGRWRDCIDRYVAMHAGTDTPQEPDYQAAVCYAHAGDPAQARRMLSQLETAARTRYVDHANIAEIYVALGEKDAAFKALEQAFADRSQPLALMWCFPAFRALHTDPRYSALMRRIYAGLGPSVTP
jgi:adenylate cyclase